MSRGWCAYMDLMPDGDTLEYAYCCYVIGAGDWQVTRTVNDGIILIERSALVEPIIHSRIKRMPSGRKKTVVKRIVQSAPISELINNGSIQVKNASGTWQTADDGIDEMALYLMSNMFREYQETGEIPKRVVCFF